MLYELKCSMCDAIYIDETQHKFKKRMDSKFSEFLRLLKNGQKYDSFAAHFEQNFKSTASRTDICN